MVACRYSFLFVFLKGGGLSVALLNRAGILLVQFRSYIMVHASIYFERFTGVLLR